MDVLKGIINFLNFIENQWATIIAFLSLVFVVYKKIKGIVIELVRWYKLEDEEKIAIAKLQLKPIILKYIADAELDYEDVRSAGQIKRSQVIDTIYEKFPILLKDKDPDALIKWIDTEIDISLEALRKIETKNTTNFEKGE